MRRKVALMCDRWGHPTCCQIIKKMYGPSGSVAKVFKCANEMHATSRYHIVLVYTLQFSESQNNEDDFIFSQLIPVYEYETHLYAGEKSCWQFPSESSWPITRSWPSNSMRKLKSIVDEKNQQKNNMLMKRIIFCISRTDNISRWMKLPQKVETPRKPRFT